MTTFSILGDVHLGKQFVANVPLHRRGEREAKVWRTFAERLGRHEADICVSTGDVFDNAIADFASLYADQNEQDFEKLTAAIKSGRITAQSGI